MTMPTVFRFLLPGFLALGLAACEKSQGIQGYPPLSNVPGKVTAYVAPYESALHTIIGPGTIGTALIVGPHFMPGACDQLWSTGDRKMMCQLRAQYLDDPKEAKPDPNARFRCVRTLGGGTECSDTAP
jgi:hypothetical protein